MSHFAIEGGHPLAGTVVPSGNKNAAMPLAEACLLTDDPITLHNMPEIGDVETVLDLLRGLGVDVQRSGSTVMLCARNLHTSEPDSRSFSQIRGSLTLMGPLLARCGHFAVKTTAGGDDIGRRRIDTHLHVFRSLGASFERNHHFQLDAPNGLRGKDILLDEQSVTATENALMAAALARGTTILRNAASEPHVQDLCHLLVAMGCPIQGIGSNTLVIQGQEKLHGAEFTVGPDYVEIGSYIGLGAITPGELRIEGIVPDHLRMMEMVFVDRLGVRMRVEHDPKATNGSGFALVVDGEQDLCIAADFGGAVPKIDDQPWPAFPPDLMSIALVTATQAKGTVLIHEKMYDGRLFFVDKLVSMGAQIILCDPHRAVVVGPSRLSGQHVTSPDIRAGMA
ncbi:MAG: UDP-N-acetylglucosamine 1-carboxyvinyltransferase, partial [Caldilineaceae bacterium]|nr:UDP-N-acetylglucosamine 1-carboxyvinyltransferase [Caldilineaceae bacterium]